MFFLGRTHKLLGLTHTDSSNKYKVYKTAHGVVLEHKDRFSWVFVIDYNTAGGPGKLRWPSIKTVKIINDLIL